MSIENLRAKALAHNASQKFRYNICLDEDLRTLIDEASTELVRKHQERATLLEGNETLARKRLGDTNLPIDGEIAVLEARIEELEASIPDDDLLVVVFGRMNPNDFQRVEIDHMDGDGRVDWAAVWAERNQASYEGCEDRHGKPVDLSWTEVQDSVLSSADLDFISQGITALNRRCSYVPFRDPSFGRRATS